MCFHRGWGCHTCRRICRPTCHQAPVHPEALLRLRFRPASRPHFLEGVPRLHLRAQHREMLRQMAMAKQARQTQPRLGNWGPGLMGRQATYHPARSGLVHRQGLLALRHRTWLCEDHLLLATRTGHHRTTMRDHRRTTAHPTGRLLRICMDLPDFHLLAIHLTTTMVGRLDQILTMDILPAIRHPAIRHRTGGRPQARKPMALHLVTVRPVRSRLRRPRKVPGAEAAVTARIAIATAIARAQLDEPKQVHHLQHRDRQQRQQRQQHQCQCQRQLLRLRTSHAGTAISSGTVREDRKSVV